MKRKAKESYIARMRASNEKYFIDETGKKVRSVTSFMVKKTKLDENAIPPETMQKTLMDELIEQDLVQPDEFSPVKNVIEESDHNTPKKAETASGRKLEKMETGLTETEFLVVLTNNPKQTAAHVRKPNKDPAEFEKNKANFEASEAYKAMIPATAEVKSVSWTMDQEQKKKVAKENRTRKGRSQNGIMAVKMSLAKEASATDYTKPLKLYKKIDGTSYHVPMEHGHLIANNAAGEASMVPENIVEMTKDANTVMILQPESSLILIRERYLNDKYSWFFKEIDLDVKASTLFKTHVGDEIFYRIKTEKFQFNYLIDALFCQKPHIQIKRYNDIATNAYIKAILKKHEAASVLKDITNTVNNSFSSTSSANMTSPSATPSAPVKSKKLSAAEEKKRAAKAKRKLDFEKKFTAVGLPANFFIHDDSKNTWAVDITPESSETEDKAPENILMYDVTPECSDTEDDDFSPPPSPAY